MKTKDHKMLSYYLIEQFDYPVKKCLKRALIWGSVEPDYNPFTYLHGSLKTEKFRGHNFDNARKCIVCLIHKIETEEMSELKRCYLLGKLIHYVADAFTFPHNNVFKGNLVQHCKYENKLHAYMAERLQKDSIAWTQAVSGKTLIEQIDKMHQGYLNGERICATDYQYILNATTLVFGYFSEEYAEFWSECLV